MNFYNDNPSLSFYLHHPEMAHVAEVRESGFTGEGAPADADTAIRQIIDNLNGDAAEATPPETN
jgi:hypothetical protein